MVENSGLFRYAFGIAVGISILALLPENGASAATIIVPHDFAKIHWAIDNATSGDTIIVQSGTYYENVKVNKKLIFKGIGMPVVDARGKGSTIKLSKNGIRLEGFKATGAGSRIENAGIKVKSDNNTLKNNDASDNNPGGKYRHGIILEYSDNNTLVHNNVSNNEYGIFLLYSNNNTLIGNNLLKNQVDFSLHHSNNSSIEDLKRKK